METVDTELLTRMNDWIAKKADSRRTVEQRKHEAWELWKRRAEYDELTLGEILDGPAARKWSPKREAHERTLFEEFWVEQAG